LCDRKGLGHVGQNQAVSVQWVRLVAGAVRGGTPEVAAIYFADPRSTLGALLVSRTG
jgi:hypothetical protein